MSPFKQHLVRMSPILAFLVFAAIREFLPDTKPFHLLALLPIIFIAMSWSFVYWNKALDRVWFIVPLMFVAGIAVVELRNKPETIRDVPHPVVAGTGLILLVTFIGLKRDWRARHRRTTSSDEPAS